MPIDGSEIPCRRAASAWLLSPDRTDSTIFTLTSTGCTGGRATAILRGSKGSRDDALRPASDVFMHDVVRHPSGAEVYRRNTELAAGRVGDLIREGVEQHEFRKVHAAFIAELIASTMERIQSGEIARATGMSDAEAYDELAALVVQGLHS